MKKSNSSLFVTFEGGEGAGKSMLVASLVKALSNRGLNVTATREPGGSELGNQIRQLLLHQEKGSISDRAELLLFLASRAQHVDKLIVPALNAGHIVLCDRFSDSTIAYQGAARGLGVSGVEHLCNFATGGLIPDITFLLDIEPEIGFKRVRNAQERGGGIDRIESEALSFHNSVRQGFLDIASRYPDRVKVIDATLPPEAVFSDVEDQILGLLNSRAKA